MVLYSWCRENTSTTWHTRSAVREENRRYPEGCAALGEVPCQGNARRGRKQAYEPTSPRKIDVTSKFPVGNIPVVTLIRTDTTLDHSQKAEKV